MTKLRYDVIIVGAGSAGCVLAARLSEDPKRSVLLLEAGPHFKTIDAFPEELRLSGNLSSSFPGHPNNWSFMGRLTSSLSYPVPRGKVVGGSSALNGAVFVRGVPEDFDGWARLGNDDWSYAKVLPYFKKLETDMDFLGDFHGSNGPIPVRRPKPEEWAPVQRAFFQACLDAGFPEDRDKNAPGSIGVGPLPMNSVNGVRMNTAVTYLEPALARPNLEVWGEVFVRRIQFEGRKAVKVEAERRGEQFILEGNEIILSAGAIKSPHLLMLSGVGPADQLRRVGIPVVHDSPNVGKNFTDHPGVLVMYQTDREQPVYPELPLCQTGLEYTAEGSKVRGDMEFLPFSIPLGNSFIGAGMHLEPSRLWLTRVFRHTLRTLDAIRGISMRRLMGQVRRRWDLAIDCLMQDAVSRGEIRIISADPKIYPELNYNYLSDAWDKTRMREAVRIVAQLLEQKPFKEIGAARTSPTDTELDSDSSLDNWLLQNLNTTIHMSSTCKMGPASDGTAVVDQHCRVRGVESLRVIDTSIMPNVVRRPANATAIMIGERAAEWVE